MNSLQVMDQYHMTQEMWEERITSWCTQHRGMLRYAILALLVRVNRESLFTELVSPTDMSLIPESMTSIRSIFLHEMTAAA